jgi:hypothetical protein
MTCPGAESLTDISETQETAERPTADRKDAPCARRQSSVSLQSLDILAGRHSNRLEAG